MYSTNDQIKAFLVDKEYPLEFNTNQKELEEEGSTISGFLWVIKLGYIFQAVHTLHRP